MITFLLIQDVECKDAKTSIKETVISLTHDLYSSACCQANSDRSLEKTKDFISKIDDLFKRFFVSILLTQSFKNQCGNISTDVFTDSILNMF